MCRFFGVSVAGYYKFLRVKQDKDTELIAKIQKIQRRCRQTYGYRRVQIALEKQGVFHNHKKILRVGEV